MWYYTDYKISSKGKPFTEDETKDIEALEKQAESGYRDWETDRKSTRLNSSHITRSRMPSSA